MDDPDDPEAPPEDREVVWDGELQRIATRAGRVELTVRFQSADGSDGRDAESFIAVTEPSAAPS